MEDLTFLDLGAWVAEPFSKWGAQVQVKKAVENFCGLNWQL